MFVRDFCWSLTYCSFYLGSAGTELSSWLFTCLVFIFSAVLVVRVPFPLGVWGRVWNSIVSVPDHYLFIYLLEFQCLYLVHQFVIFAYQNLFYNSLSLLYSLPFLTVIIMLLSVGALSEIISVLFYSILFYSILYFNGNSTDMMNIPIPTTVISVQHKLRNIVLIRP